MDSEMSDGTPVSPELDARMLSDLRTWRAGPLADLRYLTLTIDEFDMLLRRCTELEELRRELVDMPDDHFAPIPVRSIPFTAEIPDEIRERADTLPAGHAIIGGVVVPLPTEPAMRTPGASCPFRVVSR